MVTRAIGTLSGLTIRFDFKYSIATFDGEFGSLGPYAAQSRSVLAALGSRLVYGYLDEPAAPGQPSAGEVSKMVSTVRSFNR